MASGLQKILLTYDQVQDRLILSFYAHDFTEYRFWVTRRMVKSLWDVLQRLRDALSKSELQEREEDRRAAKQVKPENTSPEGDKFGNRMSRRPLGEEPLLLCKVMAKPVDKDHIAFRLEDQHGKSIDFTGSSNIVALLSQLILATLPKTSWDLEL